MDENKNNIPQRELSDEELDVAVGGLDNFLKPAYGRWVCTNPRCGREGESISCKAAYEWDKIVDKGRNKRCPDCYSKMEAKRLS